MIGWSIMGSNNELRQYDKNCKAGRWYVAGTHDSHTAKMVAVARDGGKPTSLEKCRFAYKSDLPRGTVYVDCETFYV